MKRLSIVLLVAVCCLTVSNAQMLKRNPAAADASSPHAAKAPVMKALGENQLYLGPYTSDALNDYGIGLEDYSGISKMGVVLPVDMVRAYNGGVVKAIRFGLCAAVTGGAVFVYPVTSLEPLTLGDPLVEQTVTRTAVGWNEVVLDNPFTISTEGIVGLLLGYQYKQIIGTSDASYPISVVEEGTILDTYTQAGELTGNQWQDIGLSSYGNISVQAIVEKNYTDHFLYLSQPQASKYAKVSEGLDFSVGLSNFGKKTLWDYTIDMLVDGEFKGQIDSPEALTPVETILNSTCPLDGVTSGSHIITLRVTSVDGEPVNDGASVSTEFVAYVNSFPRQKQLVEHFTSQVGSNCPQGDAVLEALQQMRDDMEWVAIHCNYNGTDVFTTTSGTQVASYLGALSGCRASFNRFDGAGSGSVVPSIAYNQEYAQQAAEMLSYTYFDSNPTPALATVKIQPSFDENTRILVLKVKGQAAEGLSQIMGGNIGLSVYLTEDDLVARQLNGGTWVQSYVHNHVLRNMPTAYNGDPLSFSGNSYEKTYQVELASEWQPEKMRVVAFVHQQGSTPNDKQVINCEATPLLDNTVAGDVNGDGKVDIADVNAIINMMLGKATQTLAGDVTGDGNVDIADVNAAINIMLGK